MKNLLTYTGTHKKFSEEESVLARIQIDNSLDLGWKKEDIMLVTDFKYEYNGVESMVIEEGTYYPFDLAASKLLVVLYLINHGLIDEKQLYWCHDFDAFENYRIEETQLGLTDFDLGLTHYTYKPEWQCGSIFFKKSAKDIFDLLHKTTITRPYSSRNNEKTLTWLIKHNAIDANRYKRLNPTYNFTKRYTSFVYKEAQKPLKVLHFRPSDTKEKDPQLESDNALNMFMYGKNSLKIPLMSDRLTRIFNLHDIK